MSKTSTEETLRSIYVFCLHLVCLTWTAWETAGIFFSGFMIIVLKEDGKSSGPCLALSREDPGISSMPGERPKLTVAGLCDSSPKCLFRAKLRLDISLLVGTSSSPPMELLRSLFPSMHSTAGRMSRSLKLGKVIYMQKCQSSVWRSD